MHGVSLVDIKRRNPKRRYTHTHPVNNNNNDDEDHHHHHGDSSPTVTLLEDASAAYICKH